MSTENTEKKKPEEKKPEEKPKRKVTVVHLLRRVKGIINNPGEVCGFPPDVAAKLLDKNRPGGPCAELYTPPK